MFKKGDKVECIDGAPRYLTLGNIYEIKTDQSDQYAEVVLNDSGRCSKSWLANRFQLSYVSALEKLIVTANAGYKASEEIIKDHRDKVEFRGGDIKDWQSYEKHVSHEVHVARVVGREYRVKQTSCQTTIAGYTVVLQGDELKVGCEKFSAKDALDSLHTIYICGEDAAKDVVAYRTGLLCRYHRINHDQAVVLMNFLQEHSKEFSK